MSTSPKEHIIFHFIRPVVLISSLLFFNILSVSTKAQKDIQINSNPQYIGDSVQMHNYWDKYWYYDTSEQYDSSKYYCEKIIEIGDRLNSIRYDSAIYQMYAKAYGGIGYALIFLGRHDEGYRYARKALDLITEQFGEYHVRAAEINVGISEYYQRKKDYEQALHYNYRSLHIVDSIFEKDHHYFGNRYGNLAIIYYLMGDFQLAVEFGDKAIAQYKKRRPQNVPYRSEWMAEVFIEKGDYKRAMEYLEQSLQFQSRFTEYTGLSNVADYAYAYYDPANVHYLMGVVYSRTDQFDKAFENLGKALKIAESNRGLSGKIIGHIHLELGLLNQMRDNGESAMQYFLQAIEAWREHYGNGHVDIIKAFRAIVHLQSQSGNLLEALSTTQLALSYLSPEFDPDDIYSTPEADRIPSRMEIIDLLMEKAKLLVQFKSKNGSSQNEMLEFETLNLAVSLSDKIRLRFKEERSKEDLLASIVPLFEAGIASALNLYEITGDPAYFEFAFQFSEKSKSLILQENLNQQEASESAGIPEDVIRDERRLSRELAVYEELIDQEKRAEILPDTSKLIFWSTKLASVKEEYDALVLGLETDYPKYFNYKYRINSPSLDDVLKNVDDPKSAIVEYFIGDSDLYIFYINEKELKYHRHQLNDSILNKVVNITGFLKDPQFELSHPNAQLESFKMFISSAYDLYQILLAPIVNVQHVNDLIIIPDNILGYLPFEVLLTGEFNEGNGKQSGYRNLPYLIKSFNVQYEYSTILIESPSVKRSNNELVYAGFAPEYSANSMTILDPTGRGNIERSFPSIVRNGLTPLQFNVPEVEAVQDLMDGRAYLYEEATVENFFEVASKSKILHLAMHTLINSENALYSQLVFNQGSGENDGSLKASEIYNMDIDAELVVLSACSTGEGKLKRGEGIFSLAKAFKYAGCPNILMSLWNANDQSSKDIIVSYFQNLKSGKKKDAALRQAKLSYLDHVDDPVRTHPFYWANFLYIGDDSTLEKNGIPSHYYLFLFFGIIFLYVLTRKNKK